MTILTTSTSGETRSERRRQAKEPTEMERIDEIQAWSSRYPKLDDLARRAISTGMSIENFLELARGELGRKVEAYEPPDSPLTELGMEKREVGQFSIIRAVNALVEHRTSGADPKKSAPFEFECSRAIEDKLDVESRGFFVPYDVQRGSKWTTTRAVPMDTSENSDLVPTDHLAGSFIPALKNRTVLLAAGARTLTGLVGNVAIPKFDSGSTFGWIAEDGDSPDTEPGTATVSLTPKTVSGSVPITRRLRKQSSPEIEQLVREDIIGGVAVAVDQGGLNGSGASNQPLGIIGITGIGTVTIAAAGQPTWAEIVEFEEDVETGNALVGNPWYIVTPAVKKHGKTTLKVSGVSGFIFEDDRMNGYPAVATNQMPANGILYGNFNDVLVGMWGVLDIRVDTATEAKKDRVTLRAFQDVDINVRNAASFSKNA